MYNKLMPGDDSPLAFPKQADKPRLTAYEHYDKLYFGDHYAAFAIKAEKGFTEKYSRLRYIVSNFAGLMSRVMADMLFGEKIVIDCDDKSNQAWVDGFVEDNHLFAQLYESALGNSRRGDSVFKLRIGPRDNSLTADSTVIAEEITPAIYFPILDLSSGRMTPVKDVLIWTFKQGTKNYIHVETHTVGYIQNEIFEYNPDNQRIGARQDVTAFGFEETQETKASRSLIFHIPNVRDGSSYFGTSDYKDLEQLFFALNNRITSIDNILDKHSDPILAVPPGVIDENGQVSKAALNLFEVDNENPGFNKPEYIVWNANLDNAMKQVDKLVDMLFMFSEISPSTMGVDVGGGQAESGRALKFKLMRTIAKRNRKKIYYDIAMKEMLETAMELGKNWAIKIDDSTVTTPEKPKIDWGDGIIPDVVEDTDVEIKRIEAGISSRADAIARLDGSTPEEAAAKVKEIDKENAIVVPSLDKPANLGKPSEPRGTVSPPTDPNAPTPPVAAPAGK